MIKFAVNLAMLFTEVPLLARFQLAAEAGFRVVEVWSPVDEGLAAAIESAGVELLQFNLDMGNLQAGDRGLLSLPNQMDRFRAGFEMAIYHTDNLSVRQLNCLVGNRDLSFSMDEQLACMRDNLEWLHPQLEANDLILNIEPLSRFHSPNYLFVQSQELFSLLRELKLPRIGVQYDLFHAQLMGDNLVMTMRENISIIGHIQIADAPGRHQPGTGEINFRYVLAEIETMGYDQFVSLEYEPFGSTEESLVWLPVECRVQAQASALKL